MGIDTTLHVHMLHAPADDHLAFLRERLAPNISLTVGAEVPPDTQILVGGRPSREDLSRATLLSALLIPYAGLPAATADLMRDFPQVQIHNLHHNAPMTAEMALALLLAAAKHLLPADRALRQGDWTPRYEDNDVFVLEGKTVLILGYGSIGRHIGAVCRTMGMSVLAVRRQPEPEAGVEVHPAEALPTLLPRAQVLMVCLPGTPETEGMIGAEELALLPRRSIVVNVGRGAVVDQSALYAALKDGHLHSAGVDVWYNYPRESGERQNTPPADQPFGELDQMVMSPHRAGGGGTDEVERRRMTAIAESLNAAARGESIPHRVELNRGY
jgi:phosphoglycerate dehydrogenase-like enzyme